MRLASPVAVISDHLQNYLLKIISIFGPIIFLLAEGVGCSLRYGNLSCETLIDSNLVVSLHLALGACFYASFAYTMQDLTMKNVATLQGCSLHTILQIFLVAVSSLVSFTVFGMRPDINYVAILDSPEDSDLGSMDTMSWAIEHALGVGEATSAKRVAKEELLIPLPTRLSISRRSFGPLVLVLLSPGLEGVNQPG